MDDLYSQTLLQAAADLPAAATLDDPDGQGRRVSKVCGSEVEVDLRLTGGLVTDAAMRVKACALGQASSSLLWRCLEGSRADELRSLRAVMEEMVRNGGAGPTGRFAALEALKPIQAYPARHASTLLIFHAVKDALDQAEARHAAA